MRVKLVMSWDIKAGRDQEYFEFVVRDFAPGITRLGFQPTEAWFTVYGKQPQIMMAGLADSEQTARRILGSKEWQELHNRLLQFVTNYNHKIVRESPYFPL
jgi:hypothetical protein